MGIAHPDPGDVGAAGDRRLPARRAGGSRQTLAAGGSAATGPGAPWLLLVALAIATPVGLLLYSIVATDLWLPRGLSASIPAAMLVLGALLATLPGVARIVAVAAVLATLAVGTIRSFSADYVREPYRAMAAYLDRHARPHDRVIAFSFIGQPAIAAMIHRPHPVLPPNRTSYTGLAPGSYLYLFLDDQLKQRLGLHTPHPPASSWSLRSTTEVRCPPTCWSTGGHSA